MKKWVFFVAISIAVSLSSYSVNKVFEIHKADQTTHYNRILFLPKTLVKLSSLGFRGVVADFLMLNIMVVHGEKLLNETPFTPDDWQKTYLGTKQIISLDPMFLDPYILAQMSLPWDAGMVEEANELLLAAAENRPNDYRPYFYLWFNYDYFLKDPATAAMYMQKAAKMHGAPRHFTSLAARSSLYGGEIIKGIIFLREMIAQSNDAGARYGWSMRLDCLEKIAFLEGKLKQYNEKFGEKPNSLAEIIDKGLLKKLPEDPYGGEFFINEFDRVYTTSKMALATKHLKK